MISRESMPRPLWNEICEAFGEAVEREGDQRTRFLAGLPAPVRTEVEALLGAHVRAGRFIEPEDDETIPPGERFGPYRITAHVAQGGMGVVYRARRDDGEFDQEVALKVISGALASREAERMFLRERQILAGLSHPHIVKLLDGGVSEGRRYFVMEWLDGQPLLDACRALDLTARLHLFRQICSAIHAAHQQLIVHRDLKPANVLVTAEGDAKVLDFGIAKLLDLGESGVGRTQLRALTLAYASPEQARGLNAGIPSDIYSLGLLLWEMLTFTPVQSVDALPLDEAIHHIAHHTPTPPPSLPRDLASIALKAMAKEPERRYGSAQELGDDVARYLGGYPVRAQRPSFLYLSNKFVRRNRTAVAIAAIAFAALLWQFFEVQRQRQAAERRFAAARRMAQVLIFEAPAQLAPLGGTLETRKMMVQRATTYLESLAQDVRGDQEFALSIARAYRQTAYTQYNIDGPNLNDPRGALQSLERGAAVLERTGLRTPPVLRELIDNRLLRPYNQLGLREDSLRNEDELDRLVVSFHEPVLLNQIRSLKSRNLARPAAERLEHLLALRATYAQDAHEPQRLRNLALTEKYLLGIYHDLNRPEDALASARRALEIDQSRLSLNPRDRAMRLDVSFDYSQLGTTLHQQGHSAEAIPHLESALAIRRELVREDPTDKRAQDRLAWILGEIGRVHFEQHLPLKALPYLREALALRTQAGDAAQHTQTAADLNHRIGLVHEALDQPAQACTFWLAAARALPSDPRVEVSKHIEADRIRARAAACR